MTSVKIEEEQCYGIGSFGLTNGAGLVSALSPDTKRRFRILAVLPRYGSAGKSEGKDGVIFRAGPALQRSRGFVSGKQLGSSHAGTKSCAAKLSSYGRPD